MSVCKEPQTLSTCRQTCVKNFFDKLLDFGKQCQQHLSDQKKTDQL